MNPPPLKKSSGLAVTSLVLGILSFCCPVVTSIAAILCGHIAHGKIKKSHGELEGAGLAVAGFVMGYITLLLGILIAVLFSSVAIPKAALIRDLSVQTLHAQRIFNAVQAMADAGVAGNDPSLGFPADAEITTVTELKARLVKNGHLTAEEIEELNFDKYLFANVSATDPIKTVFIRSEPESSMNLSVVVRMDGAPEILAGMDDGELLDPPRDPPYLEP